MTRNEVREEQIHTKKVENNPVLSCLRLKSKSFPVERRHCLQPGFPFRDTDPRCRAGSSLLSQLSPRGSGRFEALTWARHHEDVQMTQSLLRRAYNLRKQNDKQEHGKIQLNTNKLCIHVQTLRKKPLRSAPLLLPAPLPSHCHSDDH